MSLRGKNIARGYEYIFFADYLKYAGLINCEYGHIQMVSHKGEKMEKYKVCFWLNYPSNHQDPFLYALSQHDHIDLQVYYFESPDKARLIQGWRNTDSLFSYEQYIDKKNPILSTFENWKEYIHIVLGFSYQINRILVPLFIKNKVK